MSYSSHVFGALFRGATPEETVDASESLSTDDFSHMAIIPPRHAAARSSFLTETSEAAASSMAAAATCGATTQRFRAGVAFLTIPAREADVAGNVIPNVRHLHAVASNSPELPGSRLRHTRIALDKPLHNSTAFPQNVNNGGVVEKAGDVEEVAEYISWAGREADEAESIARRSQYMAAAAIYALLIQIIGELIAAVYDVKVAKRNEDAAEQDLEQVHPDWLERVDLAR